MSTQRRATAIPVLCLLAACAGEKQPDPALGADSANASMATASARVVTMLCGADTISVRGASSDSVLELHVLGETFLVGRVPSASGANYQAGSDTSTSTGIVAAGVWCGSVVKPCRRARWCRKALGSVC